MAAAADQTDLLLLAVPDGALPAVAAEVGRALAVARATAPPSGDAATPHLVVAHTSGATSVEVLAPCRSVGAAVLGFHPLQTFSDPLSGVARLRGCAVAVTTDDPRAAALAALVAAAIGAEPFTLADDDRALYHAAAVAASNYLVTLAFVAEGLFGLAGLPAGRALPALLPLMQGAVDNLRAQGTVAALTGPLSRGDGGTVAAHLDALARDAPEDAEVYRALGRATLPLLRARRELSAAAIDALDDLLSAPTADQRDHGHGHQPGHDHDHDHQHEPDRPDREEVSVP